MSRDFTSFVVFGEMRTGSNFLEASLNEFDDLKCYGEVFNPHFIGQHNRSELFGMDLQSREDDPLMLLEKMKEHTDGLSGFRLFDGHDPRVFHHCLHDDHCGKIILTRNPLDSYVSLKIARETGQWKLSDARGRKSAQIEFDPIEFSEHLNRKQAFQLEIQKGLQVTGQTAFYVGYDDIQDVDVLNGLAKFLGSDSEISKVSRATKPQNPTAFEEKVSNFKAMQSALAAQDYFGLSRTPNFEPRRGPAVPGFVFGVKTPLLFMPLQSGPVEPVLDWMARLDDVEVADLSRGLNQKAMRQWMKTNTEHRSFTVLRHPVLRAHHAFCDKIVPTSDPAYADLRRVLRNRYGVRVPKTGADAKFTQDNHKSAFKAFLKFLRANLAGQTSVRIDPAWASQWSLLEGSARVVLPDMILREVDLQTQLDALSLQCDAEPAAYDDLGHAEKHDTADIYDEEIERLAADAYRRDYLVFGFGAWKET